MWLGDGFEGHSDDLSYEPGGELIGDAGFSFHQEKMCLWDWLVDSHRPH